MLVIALAGSHVAVRLRLRGLVGVTRVAKGGGRERLQSAHRLIELRESVGTHDCAHLCQPVPQSERRAPRPPRLGGRQRAEVRIASSAVTCRVWRREGRAVSQRVPDSELAVLYLPCIYDCRIAHRRSVVVSAALREESHHLEGIAASLRWAAPGRIVSKGREATAVLVASSDAPPEQVQEHA